MRSSRPRSPSVLVELRGTAGAVWGRQRNLPKPECTLPEIVHVPFYNSPVVPINRSRMAPSLWTSAEDRRLGLSDTLS